MCDGIFLWGHVILEFCLLEVLITVSISVLMIGLFIFFLFSELVLGDYTFLRMCPFLLCYPFYWQTLNCLKKKKVGLKLNSSENKDHGIWSHHFMANRWGNSGNSVRLFFWAPKSLQMVSAAMKLKDTYSLEEKLWAT